MDYDITRFTFLADPLNYQAAPDELCVYLPAGLPSVEMLINSLGESTGCSTDLDITWWNTLYHVLGWRADWKSSPPRITLIHSDLPKLADLPHRWQEQQSYLRLLLEIMDEVQEKGSKRVDPFRQCKLTVIFPTQVFEELQAALFHPPVWQITIERPEFGSCIAAEWDTTWPTVLRYLHYLDGLMAPMCTLEREDRGYLNVYYRRENATYCVEYHKPQQNYYQGKFASVEDDFSAFTGLSFALTSQIVETFFTSGQLLSSVHWLALDNLSCNELEVLRGEHYSRGHAEARLILNQGMIRSTIQEGMWEGVNEHGEQAFSLKYWQEVLTQPTVPAVKRLAAICIIGLSDLPEAFTLVHPYLQSPEKRERWVSATIFELRQEEHEDEMLPILLSMLTDELPLKRAEGVKYDAWYDCWRSYALRLLRKWQTPEIVEHLRDAFKIWVQSEPLFDPDFDAWERCEEELCYELGYRGDLTVLNEMTLDEKRREKLQMEIRRGNTQKTM